jgi:alginate O-acetyltransferase complex protein AlgJ
MSDTALRLSQRTRRGLVAGVGMAVVLAASLPVNLAFVRHDTDADNGGPGFVETWLRGGRTAEITKLYNETFVLRDTGIDLFGVLNWVLFSEGRPGVLVGTDGWLYSTEEFQSDAGSAARVEASVARIAEVRRALANRGVDLVVTLVPAKARIVPETLGRYRWPAEPAGRLPAAVAALEAAGVTVADPSAALAAARPVEEVFLRTDTHWTSFGAGVTAGVVADVVAGLPDIGDPVAFTLAAGEPVEVRGDLLRYVRLGVFTDMLGPAPDRLVPVEAEGGADDLLGDAEIPIALVGTSYSADTRWGFDAQLKVALQRDVLNVAEEGKGPFEPMDGFLASPALQEAPPRLVIWEIPERFLDDPLPAATVARAMP